MSQIVIPQRLSELLTKDRGLRAAVDSTIEAFEPWLEDKTTGLTFFPDFTDHGTDHINRVIRSAEALISESAWSVITARDAGVLIIASLLHDSAMHLTEDSFLMLLEDSAGKRVINGFNDAPWSDAWETFFDEARRWDGRKFRNLFGQRGATSPDEEEEEGDYSRYVRRPSDIGDAEYWPKAYRRFIGEFIRRHHARLAHEIAVFGVPGPGDSKEWINLPMLEPEIADLCGIVARSHNIALRDTFEYLRAHFDGVALCRDSHPIFLMVLLRIGDFLEIHADRAPSGALKVRLLRSPISQREWNVHHAIVDVRSDEFDTEGIFIVAKPDDAAAFLRVKSLLADL